MSASERLRDASLFGWCIWAPVVVLGICGFVPDWAQVVVAGANLSVLIVALWLHAREARRAERMARHRADARAA